MIVVATLLLFAALVLLLMAAFGVVHQRVQLVPLALALVVLVYLLPRFMPP